MECHEVCTLFPAMTDEELQGLAKDIATNGLREPIWTYQGKIIDGRNRYKACCVFGIAPKFQEWDGSGSLLAFVTSLNLHRRHLTASRSTLARSSP